LIDDLLDVARITRGKLVLRKHPTTLEDILRSAIETAVPLIEHGHHPLQLQLPSQPVPLFADGARLSQVFANLLNNAAKYSDAGSEIVLLASVADDTVEVQVRDHGIGLGPEQQQQIFELFTQADNAIERAHGGLGIGLTLVRHLVEMHGGEVWVHSNGLGHGSEFRVRLPREPRMALPTPAAPTPEVALPLAGNHRALVVDDNHDAADTLAMMLELMGLQVRRLYEPRDVETEFAAFAPDVVFLDVGMPGRSGYDVASALRALPGGNEVLLVAITGWDQPEDRRRTQAAGFDQHLVKPPELDAIRDICAGLGQRVSA
jgi:CheY-like chemotaxis protein